MLKFSFMSSNHDWRVPAVWMGALSCWITTLLLENNEWIMGGIWLPNRSTYSLAVCRPWRAIMGKQNTIPQYCCHNYHRISSVFYCLNQVFRIVGFLGCITNVISSRCKEQREERLIWLYHALACSCLTSRFYGRDTTVYESEHYFRYSEI